MSKQHGGMQKGRPEIMIDNQPYQWEKETITGAEIRALAGLPQNVQIFQEVPGSPDKLIEDATVIELEEHGTPKRFSSQSVGSQAGDL